MTKKTILRPFKNRQPDRLFQRLKMAASPGTKYSPKINDKRCPLKESAKGAFEGGKIVTRASTKETRGRRSFPVPFHAS